jgi:hypothetical protein
VLLHELEVLDHPFVVPDAVHPMDFGKILQTLTGKVGALEAPGHLLFPGAAAESVPAIAAGGIDMVGKAPIAADGFDGDSVRLRHFLQFFLILILIGEVSGASFAVQPADSNQSVLCLFHGFLSFPPCTPLDAGLP